MILSFFRSSSVTSKVWIFSTKGVIWPFASAWLKMPKSTWGDQRESGNGIHAFKWDTKTDINSLKLNNFLLDLKSAAIVKCEMHCKQQSQFTDLTYFCRIKLYEDLRSCLSFIAVNCHLVSWRCLGVVYWCVNCRVICLGYFSQTCTSGKSDETFGRSVKSPSHRPTSSNGFWPDKKLEVSCTTSNLAYFGML